MSMRRVPAARGRKGVIALLFIPVITIIIMFVGILMNAAQIGLNQVMTANSADAAALGGASYLASGMWETAWAARKSDTVILHAKANFLPPFLWQARNEPKRIWATYFKYNDGPLIYFAATIQGVADTAWRMGCVAMYTGHFNNLRNSGGMTSGDPQSIQMQLFQSPGGCAPGPTAWSAGNFQVTSAPTFTYVPRPNAPMTGMQMKAVVWKPEPASFDFYHCDEALENGPGLDVSGEDAGVPDVTNPLAFGPNNLKKYEDPIYENGSLPDFGAIPFVMGDQLVCGMLPAEGMAFANGVKPSTVTLGANNVSASVNTTATGDPGIAAFGGWKSEPATKTATAGGFPSSQSLDRGSWLAKYQVNLQ